MKRSLTLAIGSLILGIWMLFDSIFAWASGRFIIDEQYLPWVKILERLSITAYDFIPGLLALGAMWLFCFYSITWKKSWAKSLVGSMAFFSLFYAPLGTLCAQIAITILVSYKMPQFKQTKYVLIAGIGLSAITTSLISLLI